jgi:Bacteriocin-protection, YdeI or OmpD-Associated/Domain of unknown function (DUF1905)
MTSFKTRILKIGVNPYVALPQSALRELFKHAGKETSPIPVRGSVNGFAFKQNLMKYRRRWRLYLNTPMRRGAAADVGDYAQFRLAFDPLPRIEPMPPAFRKALEKTPYARAQYEKLAPSRKKEICRYLNSAKAETTRTKNIWIIVAHLTGKNPRLLRPLMRIS